MTGDDAAAAAAVIAAITGTGANGALPGGAAGGSATSTEAASGFSMGGFIPSLKKFGGFFNYMTTRWSLACFVVVCRFNLWLNPLIIAWSFPRADPRLIFPC